MNEIRYEFIMTTSNGEAMNWGYRKHEDAAKKRYAELQGWVKNRDEWASVEVHKKICSCTLHPVDWA